MEKFVINVQLIYFLGILKHQLISMQILAILLFKKLS